MDSNTGNLVTTGRPKSDPNPANLRLPAFIYVDTLSLLYINEKLLQKVELPKVRKSSQSEEIHFSHRYINKETGI